jgi:diguanylate cyclase (GGDEF)-like protein/PAS domain S-box-containing protein
VRFLREQYMRKTLLMIIAVLATFLLISDSIIYLHHRDTIYTEFREARERELKLIAMLSRDALLRRDQTSIRELAVKWGMQQQALAGLKISNPDGSLIAGFQRTQPGPSNIKVVQKVVAGEGREILFELTADTSGVDRSLNVLLLELAAVSILLFLMLALCILVVLRRLAIAPLRKEVLRRKKILTKLIRVSRDKRRLLESAGEGIFSIQRDCTCTFINDAALGMLGFKRSEVIGKNIHNLIHHTDTNGMQCQPKSCQILTSLSEVDGVVVDDDRFWRSDGASFPVMYSAFPLDEDEGRAGVVVVFHDTTRQQSARRLLEYQASHDPLTGLVNRREFERRLDRAVETARMQQKAHVLLYMDLDNFKQVNDSVGHQAGDELLRQVAQRMSSIMRERDTLARLGGDEFAVLLEHCSQDVALRISGEISDAVCREKFSWDGRQFVIGISIGMVEVNAGCASSSAAMDAADGACYLAKQLGGCQVQSWSPTPPNNGKMH